MALFLAEYLVRLRGFLAIDLVLQYKQLRDGLELLDPIVKVPADIDLSTLF
jgi:hypothetical protein